MAQKDKPIVLPMPTDRNMINLPKYKREEGPAKDLPSAVDVNRERREKVAQARELINQGIKEDDKKKKPRRSKKVE